MRTLLVATARNGITVGGVRGTVLLLRVTVGCHWLEIQVTGCGFEKRYCGWRRLREAVSRLEVEKRIAVAAREKPNQTLQQTPPRDGVGYRVLVVLFAGGVPAGLLSFVVRLCEQSFWLVLL
ncbi:MAG: hypothetical protein LC104_10100 [Bacteroidales bacterium]|nr:hypothetical protein [Bacteroidales bacterium]